MNWTALLILLTAVKRSSQGWWIRPKIKNLNREVNKFTDLKCSVNLRMKTLGVENKLRENKGKIEAKQWFDKLDKQYNSIVSGKERLDLLSWVAGIVAVVATTSLVAATAGVISPFIGLAALIYGFYGNYKEKGEKIELQNNINKALTQITQKVDEKLDEIKLYVDSTTMALEKGLIKNEFEQMYGLIADCISMDEVRQRQQCFSYRCSYIKAGFYKFAVNYDELAGEKAKDLRELFESLSGLDIKRIYVSIPMFLTYVDSLLIPCEGIRMIYLTKTYNSTESALNPFDLDADKNNWRLDNKINYYLGNASALLKYSYTYGYRKLEDSAVIIDYGLVRGSDEIPATITIQCRLRMNNFDSDTCDYQTKFYEREWKKIVKDEFDEDEELAVKYYCVVKNKYRSKEPDYHELSIPYKNTHFDHGYAIRRSWRKVTFASDMATKLKMLYEGPRKIEKIETPVRR